MISDILSMGVLFWAFRKRKGKFNIVSSGNLQAIFQTDFGRFTIDRLRSVVSVSHTKRDQEIPFSSIVNLNYGKAEKSGAIEEMILGGFDTKLDVVEWHIISLVLNDDRTIPIYAIGQYKERLPCPQWLVDMAEKLSRWIGLEKDIRKLSTSVFNEIQRLFADAGHRFPVPPLPVIDEAEQVSGGNGGQRP
jgi:hypothetical protein